MNYSKMTTLEWDEYIAEKNRLAKLNDGFVDMTNAKILRADISVMDSSAPAPLDPRAAYIASLSAEPQAESVLTQAYRDRNQRAALSGLVAPYMPDTGGSPEN